MPIYAYRCEHCGHAKDVLQKVSDPVLTVCPACGESTFRKQVTAAGFQLKGSGWYVTDFRGDKPGKREGAEANDGTDGKGAGGEQAPAPKGADSAAPAAAEGKAAETPKSAPAAAASPAPVAPAASPAASGSGSSGSGSSGGGRQG
jgi:putative FmdB family regulatory protein